ncbi:Glutathione S-transferase domain-containing protein [Monocercomonoides exilis]|uniref:Glutathione S-transferase domain-containing protein n=1 Tax=Monocercomonoides exilis TaxID=2049356 RepID=UPI00355AB2C5|nr:Glutathione S-transferase domain-containing protein [Monocercomonoides exilis]|eukprot:MONOS_1094.1-p1 / transcript=MONOS_1094.1 / gene=MONOS_1094 / organism=Monocercomonoides_exilis_PA203 / gene_product=Glutathione S-transferase domain-containing protein / transcript_product=Glutathione S-transferase domain-containing protein / location=Mono_scaffold00018:196229-197534(+) / protein_length=420 / sequence_SO=supercontig / SO=protein_coding / is_pseudo=false
MSCCCDKVTLYCEEGSVLNKIQIAAKINKIDLVVVNDVAPKDQKAKEHLLELSPLGIFPVMTYPGGHVFGANAILRTIARSRPLSTCCYLYGRSAAESGNVDQWLDVCEERVEHQVEEIAGQITQKRQYNPPNYQRATKSVREVVDRLEKILFTKTFLVGERCSLADISLATSLSYIFAHVYGQNDRKGLICVTRWMNTILNLCPVKSVLGEFKLCENGEQPPKPEKPKKEQKPKEEHKPKEEKKEEVEEKEEEEEQEYVEDPNAPLNMDWWKRLYSNTKPANYKEMWPKLWKKLDDDKFEHFSIYFCEYKFPKEFDQAFKLCNLVSGWLQRLESIRKTAFGSVLILGKNGDLQSMGCWLWNDKDMPAGMSECPDFESWTWRKMDPASEADRKLFEELCEWEGSFGGKNVPCIDGKTFK